MTFVDFIFLIRYTYIVMSMKCVLFCFVLTTWGKSLYPIWHSIHFSPLKESRHKQQPVLTLHCWVTEPTTLQPHSWKHRKTTTSIQLQILENTETDPVYTLTSDCELWWWSHNVAVITPALHAEDLGFKPQRNHIPNGAPCGSLQWLQRLILWDKYVFFLFFYFWTHIPVFPLFPAGFFFFYQFGH